MASASTSYGFGNDGYAFDVFLNYRGPDLKKDLASLLYHSLSKHGLRVFLDRKEMQIGENIPAQIEGAIKTASLHIAIFSPHYAESPWCLNELVQMLETGKTIIPVFYKVNPSDLRWVQSGKGVYAHSVRNLAEKRTIDGQARHDFHTIEKWTNALSAVAEIKGFDLETYNGDEGLLVEEVVKQVLRKVAKPPLSVAKYPTGLDNEAENFERTVLSQQKGEKTIVAGIVGSGGVGKTTLAKELFNRHRSNYDRFCFLFDAREHAAKGSLNVLQRKLLEDLAQLDVDISSTDEGVETLKMHLPSSQRVLVVIDDVDHISQLEALVSPIQHTIHSSSLILVTSRSKDVLRRYGILESFIYQQNSLNRQHSRELFCLHAFHQPYPPTVFEQMVEQFLDVIGGLPLSLKVIGALLCHEDLHYWEAQFNKISTISPIDILSSLKISYDSLEYEEKQIFLDAACFLIGEERDTAIRIWEGSRWQGWLGLRNLENKFLLEVDSENRIRMHNHLRDLGRDIANGEIPHRLWRSDHIVSDHSPVRGISMVHGTDPEESFEIPADIRGLQLLRAHGTSVKRIFDNAESPQLVWLSWYSCPFSSLPSWISVKNLRVLHIEGEILETLWQDQSQPPLELRELDIDANILNVPKSIGMLKYLEKFVLRRRKNCGGNTVDLKTLPDEICGMHSLKHLELVGCKNITLLPDSVGEWTNLQLLVLGGCSALQGLPYSAGNWTSLRQIDLGGCYSLEGLPDSAGNWTSLQQIDLGGCSALQGLPYSAGEWTSLQQINLGRCSALRSLPDLFGNWTSLQWINLVGCSALQKLPDTAGNWTSFPLIDLGGCSSLQGLPDSAGEWKSLQRIDLGGCSSLKRLPDSAGNWKNLQWINLGGCSNLEKLPHSAGHWTSLQRIDLGEYSPLHLAYNWKSKGLPESMENWRHLKYSHVGSSALLYASSISNYVYDVFINCHGPDVKRTFASHLNQRFASGQLRPFLDKDERHEEDNIATQIKETIATASVHVVIFSPRYAESRRCLDELLLILDSGAPVIAVFYEVRRCDLQWTKDKVGVYGRALQNHEKRTTYDSQTNENKPRDNSNTIEEWRKALSYISGPGISGFELQAFKGDEAELLNGVARVYGRASENHEKSPRYDSQTNEDKPGDNSNTKALSNISGIWIRGFELQSFNGDEAELLDAVVESVFKSVRKAPFYEVRYLKDLDQMVEDFEKKVPLHRQSGKTGGAKPRVLGIVGEAGVGKTTLAKELSNRKSSSFNRACILFDVSGTVARSSLHLLQSKLFKDLTNMDIQIESFAQGIDLFTKHASSINYGATAFVILDNVDNVHQLKALLLVQDFLPRESLILITSRCEDVLKDSGVEQSSIYHLTDPLSDKPLSDKPPSCLDLKVKHFANTIQQPGEKPQVVGIVGIGGIGKTRLAMEFFNRNMLNYMRSYFFYDVNETACRSFSLHNLLSKLLQGLTHLDLQVEGVDEGINLFRKHVSSLPSLVILDNVVHWHQLSALLSVLSVLHSRSLILITCREEEVLNCSEVQVSSIYELNRLNIDDSKELFCTHAFGQPRPRQGFQALADKFLTACNGLPLTLKVFGALLRGKTKSSWQTQFNKLHRIRPDHIEKRLQLCYDDLDEEEERIFLHIACCCIGEERGLAVRLWDASGSIGSSVFEKLQKRCLVDVDSEDCLFMHEYLRELGRSIADEKGLRGRKGPRQSSNERVITEVGRSDGDLSQQRSRTALTVILITMITAMMIWNIEYLETEDGVP